MLDASGAAPMAAAAPAPQTTRFAESLNRTQQALKDIDFRRGSDGAGRVIVELPSNQVGVDIRQQGAEPGRRVPALEPARQPAPPPRRHRFRHAGAEHHDHAGRRPRAHGGRAARRLGAQRLPERQPVRARGAGAEGRSQQAGRRASGYAGEKLSLNFQNIEVRALLQVIADFTNFNVVTSDTVTGNVTLRLKDVPWDQALDIILQAKNLGLRKSGNVILIAPKDELNAKEKIELEAKQQIAALEPLRTQAFQLNYAKAEDIAKGIDRAGRRQRQGERRTATRILSPRGSVVFEARTNQLFVSDIPSKLEEIQNLIAKIDIPVRQVLIESRIVIADDTFGRSLGVRLGAADLRGTRGGLPGYSVGGDTRVVVGGNLQRGRRADAADTGRRRVELRRHAISSTCRRPARTASTRRRFALSLFGASAQPLPQPRDLGARGRRQGQGRLEPARHHRRPAEGADRAGRGTAVPGRDVERRDLAAVPQGQPEARGHAADHARRQRHPRRRRHEGQRRPRHRGRLRDQHQAREDAGAGRERRHRRDRRHLRAERPRGRHQGAAPRRRAGPRQPVQDDGRTRRARPSC